MHKGKMRENMLLIPGIFRLSGSAVLMITVQLYTVELLLDRIFYAFVSKTIYCS